MQFPKKYPHTMQVNDNDCAIACISSLFKFYKIDIPYDQIKKSLHAATFGITINQIYNYLLKHGIKSEYFKIPKKLGMFQKKFSHNQFPCIGLLDEKDYGHYIVIYEIKKGNIIYSDPAYITIQKSNSLDFLNKIKIIIYCDFDNFHYCDDKNKETKFNFLKDILLTYKVSFLLISIISIITAILQIFLSSKIGIIVNLISIKENDSFYLYVLIFFSILIFLSLLVTILNYIRKSSCLIILRKIEKDINSTIFDKILKRHFSQFKELNAGEIVSRLNDCNIVTNSLTNFILLFLSDFIITIFIIVFLFILNSKLLIIMFIFLILNIIISKIYYKKILVYNFNTIKLYSKLYGKLVEMIEQFTTIKTFNSENFFRKNLSNSLKNYNNTALETDRLTNYFETLLAFLSTSTSVIIILIGFHQVIKLQMSLGNLIIFLSLSSIVQNFILKAVQFQIGFEKLCISSERINQIVCLNDLSEISKNENIVLNEIQVKDFSLYFGDNLILNNTSISLNKKNIILSADSGTGKSSFAKCLAGLEDNYIGEILLNKTKNNMFKIIYLSTDSKLFEGTLLDNLCLGNEFDKDDVINACRSADIYDYISLLPNTFEYQIRSNESNISNGQKQRLLIARAILAKPQLIIFDEILSSLDNQQRNKIISNLQKYNFTNFIITHSDINVTDAQFITINDKKLINLQNDL